MLREAEVFTLSGEGVHFDRNMHQMGSMVSRTNKELTTEDIAKITDTYHAWRSTRHSREGGNPVEYEDIPGFCKAATLEEIKANDYVLTPGRYVGAAEIEDDGIPFETKMKELSQTLYQQMQDAEKLDAVIRGNLAQLGYPETGTKQDAY